MVWSGKTAKLSMAEVLSRLCGEMKSERLVSLGASCVINKERAPDEAWMSSQRSEHVNFDCRAPASCGSSPSHMPRRAMASLASFE